MRHSKPGVNWDEIRQRYEAGESANGIAQTVDVSKQAILGRIKRHGWKQTASARHVAKRQATKATQLATLANSDRAPISFKEWWGQDTPETRSMIVDTLDRGATLKLAAQAAGIGEATLHRWKAEDPEFAAQCEAAKAGHAVAHIGVIDTAGRKTHDWKASAHLLAKNPLTKADYGDTAKAGGPTIQVVLQVARGTVQATIGPTIDLNETITIEATDMSGDMMEAGD